MAAGIIPLSLIMSILLSLPILARADQKHSQRPVNPAQFRSHQMNQPKIVKSDRYTISQERIEEIRMLLKSAQKELKNSADQAE
ncbi:hypothetical protein GF413_03150 [Candidatus Micrarchaeota archaeon]|nr:hypothetical protein [Candidatus Micrarchaeota archaeon]